MYNHDIHVKPPLFPGDTKKGIFLNIPAVFFVSVALDHLCPVSALINQSVKSTFDDNG